MAALAAQDAGLAFACHIEGGPTPGAKPATDRISLASSAVMVTGPPLLERAGPFE